MLLPLDTYGDLQRNTGLGSFWEGGRRPQVQSINVKPQRIFICCSSTSLFEMEADSSLSLNLIHQMSAGEFWLIPPSLAAAAAAAAAAAVSPPADASRHPDREEEEDGRYVQEPQTGT